MLYEITPVPKPRMTRADRWKKRPAVLRYFAFCDEVRLAGVKIPNAGAKLIFHLPMPASWSKKKQGNMAGTPHQKRPDLDNLIKALLDAVLSEDACVWQYEATKLWAKTGAIEVIDTRKKGTKK